jgi:hypothetical protein
VAGSFTSEWSGGALQFRHMGCRINEFTIEADAEREETVKWSGAL